MRRLTSRLLPDILEGRIEPGRMFDRVVGLDEVLEGYRACRTLYVTACEHVYRIRMNVPGVPPLAE